MTPFRYMLVFELSSFMLAAAMAQQGGFSKDNRITPEAALGLPKDNTRTSEPFVTRIYKTDDSDNILKKQPTGLPIYCHRRLHPERE